MSDTAPSVPGPADDPEVVRLRAEAEAAEAELRLARARADLAAAEAAAAKARAAAGDAAAPTAAPEPSPAATAPLSDAQVAAIAAGYAGAGAALDLGVLVNGGPVASVPVRIPLAMTNRHGLVAGATGARLAVPAPSTHSRGHLLRGSTLQIPPRDQGTD